MTELKIIRTLSLTTSAILALLETSIGIISRLRVVYSRQKAQSSIIEQRYKELQSTESIIHVVHREECLQTAEVISELVKIKDLSQELLALVKRLDPGEKSIPHQIAHQLTSGSKDEGDFNHILNRLNTAKTNLILHIQVAGVGLSLDSQSNIVANTAQISNLDQTMKKLLGDGWGLKIASVIRHQPPRKLLGLNGPVGEDEWKSISHLEIRDNEAGVASSQINYPVSGTVFASLLFDHCIKYILLLILIYLPFNYLFAKK
ncbi:hypothetical protein N7475_007544 [Penicillium sp. IBT 31633x]|nr:hypothetical protein N7475_007544 [Penicillium sp. IBT 31633x]